MFYLRIILTSILSLKTNLLRSLLATIGVIIGVAAVVAAMSIIEGLTREVEKSIESFGSNVLQVFPGAKRQGGRQVGEVQTLSIDDADAIAAQCPAVIRSAPEVMGVATVKFFNKNTQGTVLGTMPQYTEIRAYNVEHGRFFTRSDVKSEAYVAVLGHKVAQELFGNGSPLGFVVKIQGKTFTVIGVMEKKGTIGFTRVDEQVIIPVTTAMKRLFGYRNIHSISAQAKDTHLANEAQKQISTLLRKRHKTPPGVDDDFAIFSQEQISKSFRETSQRLGLVFYSIAGISLVVGGIGIANIMLVSVTERTREIGVRMAVGAQRFDILSQFLAESSLISVVGGSIGVLVGVGFSKVLTGLSANMLKVYVAPSAVIIALTVAFITGMISGIYPAYKASRLDPVEALRYE
ncbi:MAG: FtsX-like permease family protein [Phycisphaerae bacterium]|jgi:putative ABC transport system permease protein|nr:FtsX-like permease family protein [Phycisphaerae bacterium]